MSDEFIDDIPGLDPPEPEIPGDWKLGDKSDTAVQKTMAALSDEELTEAKTATSKSVQEETDMQQAEKLFWSPTHGLAADVLLSKFGNTWIFERFDISGNGEFYCRHGCYYEPVIDAVPRARRVLEQAVEAGLELAKANKEPQKADKVYSAAGKALRQVQTRYFIVSSLFMFSQEITKIAIPWNATPEAIATLTQVLDFSGPKATARNARRDEYFRDPVPLDSESILQSGACPIFEQFMRDLFPDVDTCASALHCLGATIGNKAQKTFWLWHNKEGDGGKNTLMDLVKGVLPGRMAMLKGALILYKGDKSERRFGEIELRGRTAGFFDEVGGTFDIAAIKRYTGLSLVRGEAKGRDSIEFSQSWALIAMCNELPRFFPATDSAFLSRIFVLPFGSVFYADDEARLRHIELGVDPGRLLQAREKSELMDDLMVEHAAILRALVESYVDMRDNHHGRPFESAMCCQARESYRASNDVVEQFFAEYLRREESGRISYADLLDAWVDFSGDQKATTRGVVKQITERFKWTETKLSHGVRSVYGIVAKVHGDSADTAEKQEEYQDEMEF